LMVGFVAPNLWSFFRGEGSVLLSAVSMMLIIGMLFGLSRWARSRKSGSEATSRRFLWWGGGISAFAFVLILATGSFPSWRNKDEVVILTPQPEAVETPRPAVVETVQSQDPVVLLWEKRIRESKVLNLKLSELNTAIRGAIAANSEEGGKAFFHWAKARWGEEFQFRAWEWFLFRQKVHSSGLPLATEWEVSNAQKDLIGGKETPEKILDHINISLKMKKE